MNDQVNKLFIRYISRILDSGDIKKFEDDYDIILNPIFKDIIMNRKVYHIKDINKLMGDIINAKTILFTRDDRIALTKYLCSFSSDLDVALQLLDDRIIVTKYLCNYGIKKTPLIESLANDLIEYFQMTDYAIQDLRDIYRVLSLSKSTSFDDREEIEEVANNFFNRIASDIYDLEYINIDTRMDIIKEFFNDFNDLLYNNEELNKTNLPPKFNE